MDLTNLTYTTQYWCLCSNIRNALMLFQYHFVLLAIQHVKFYVPSNYIRPRFNIVRQNENETGQNISNRIPF